MNWTSKTRLTGSFLRLLDHGIEIIRLAFRFQSMLALGQSKKASFQLGQDRLHIFGKPRPEKNDHEKPKQKQESQETPAAVQKAFHSRWLHSCQPLNCTRGLFVKVLDEFLEVLFGLLQTANGLGRFDLAILNSRYLAPQQ